MANDAEQNDDFGKEARALLGDEMLNPPSAASPPPLAVPEELAEIPLPPLPDIPLAMGPELPNLTRGAAWCFAASIVFCAAAGLAWWQTEWFTTEPSYYFSGTVLLGAALAHLRGLFLLCRIELEGGKRHHLELSFVLSSFTFAVLFFALVLYAIQPTSSKLNALLSVGWIFGLGASWAYLVGLRRVGLYVNEPRLIFQSHICQIIVGIMLYSILIQACLHSAPQILKKYWWFFPSLFVRVFSTFTPTLQITAAIGLLGYVYGQWLLWRACVRAQRQAAGSS